MKYRLIWLLGVGAVALLLAWLVSQMEPYQVEPDWVELSGEASTNPFFAAREFLDRIGIPARSTPTLSDALPLPSAARGTVLFLAGSRYGVSDQRSEQILQWVRDGGRLWLEAPLCAEQSCSFVDDPILGQLGFNGAHAQEAHGDQSEMEANSTEQDRENTLDTAPGSPASGDAASDHSPDNLYLPLDTDQIFAHGEFQIMWSHCHAALVPPPDADLLTSITCDGHLVVAQQSLGNGVVTITANHEFLHNQLLHQQDNGAFFWWLLDQGQAARGVPTSRLVFVLSDDMPPLWRWLARHAPALLVSLAILVALLIWRAWPRFGPLRESLPGNHRSLDQHLDAAGRYYWRHQHTDALLDQLRKRLWRDLRQRTTHLPSDPARADLTSIAALLDLPEPTLRQAFVTSHQFTTSLRALQRLRHAFSRNTG